MTWVKICGITNREDALKAVSLGVDAVGFIFAESPRRVDPFTAREIIRHLPSSLLKVGVFVNEAIEEVERISGCCSLNGVQFHGEESPEYCRQVSLPVIRAVRIKNSESLEEIERYPFASILLDTWSENQAGGTGKGFSWGMALEARRQRNFILSGGLSPANVREAIHLLRPEGVDVCSGVERCHGKKDPILMKAFIEEVRKADEST